MERAQKAPPLVLHAASDHVFWGSRHGSMQLLASFFDDIYTGGAVGGGWAWGVQTSLFSRRLVRHHTPQPVHATDQRERAVPVDRIDTGRRVVSR